MAVPYSARKTSCPTPYGRFFRFVNKTPTCWEWTGWRTLGYGQFGIHGKVRGAHRISYEWHVGPIPDGMEIDHLCRNPGCVNPAHLEPVTDRENKRRVAEQRTHCPQGHPYSGDNLVIERMFRRGRVSLSRKCRTCVRATAKRGYHRRKAMAA